MENTDKDYFPFKNFQVFQFFIIYVLKLSISLLGPFFGRGPSPGAEGLDVDGAELL